MKLISLLLLILCLSQSAYGLKKRKKQAFCYDQNGVVKGHNIDKNLRVASLSKLFSSYFIATHLGLDHQYKTSFELTSTHKLIIRGNKDPYFLEHGIFYIISNLAKAGVKGVIEVLIDDDFYFHFKTDQNKFLKKLNYYFNTNQWDKIVSGNPLKIKDQYKQVRKLIKTRIGGELIKKPNFTAKKIRRMTKKDTQLGNTVAKWILPSVKMIHYLKILNSYSNNMTTDEFIDQLGGIRKMNRFFKKNGYGLNFVTGSGLNLGAKKSRKDNYASCRKVLKVMDELRKLLESSGYEPTDLLPMASDDVGTLSSRFSEWGFKQSFVFKTGTLKIKPTSALSAMHRTKSLNLVVLAQDYTEYPKLKANEINILEHMINEVGIKPINKDYQPKEFLMFEPMLKASF